LIWSDLSSCSECWDYFFLSVFDFAHKEREVFPPEPPIVSVGGPERRGAGQGAPVFGASEANPCQRAPFWHSERISMGGSVGNTFLLVSLELAWLDGRAENSRGAGATVDHTDIRGSEPQEHDSSGASSD
jgi:hypothetical protein